MQGLAEELDGGVRGLVEGGADAAVDVHAGRRDALHAPGLASAEEPAHLPLSMPLHVVALGTPFSIFLGGTEGRREGLAWICLQRSTQSLAVGGTELKRKRISAAAMQKTWATLLRATRMSVEWRPLEGIPEYSVRIHALCSSTQSAGKSKD